jgi:hypothetical protein
MYKQQGAEGQAQAGQPQGDPNAGKAGDEVQDVDFEEVK